jgi:hypothetical protein
MASKPPRRNVRGDSADAEQDTPQPADGLDEVKHFGESKPVSRGLFGDLVACDRYRVPFSRTPPEGPLPDDPAAVLREWYNEFRYMRFGKDVDTGLTDPWPRLRDLTERLIGMCETAADAVPLVATMDFVEWYDVPDEVWDSALGVWRWLKARLSSEGQPNSVIPSPDPPHTTNGGNDARVRTPDSKPDTPKNSLPNSPDVRDLCHLLQKGLPNGHTQSEIAREFTREMPDDDKKAQSLLRQARRFSDLWKPADK